MPALELDAEALSTLARVKVRMGIKEETADHDDLLIYLLHASSAEASRFCQRRFRKQIYTDEAYDGSGDDLLALRQWPVAVLTNIKIDGSVEGATSYVLKAGSGLVYRKVGSWPIGLGNLTATYDAGYTLPQASGYGAATDKLPFDFEDAVIKRVAHLFQHKDRIGEATFVSPEGLNLTLVSDLPKDIERVYLSYRRR